MTLLTCESCGESGHDLWFCYGCHVASHSYCADDGEWVTEGNGDRLCPRCVEEVKREERAGETAARFS